MFREYLIKKLAALYEDKIIIFDYDDIESRYSYAELLSGLGFKVVKYEDATHFRYIYHIDSMDKEPRIAIVVSTEQYVPYDILKNFYRVDIGWDKLFPNLNKEVLVKDKTLDLDLLYSAYHELYESLSVYETARNYITEKVYGKENVKQYLAQTREELSTLLSWESLNYNDWLNIAEKKGKAEYLAAKGGLDIDFSFIDGEFRRFILNEYSSISGIIQRGTPVMVSRVMDFISKKNDKVALIVLDGMSVFDFKILAEEFDDIDYREHYIYAMVPTTTAISRQSLLTGKFPVELERPFGLSGEEKGFVEKAKSLGYLQNQILYTRGSAPNIGPSIKCLCVILNDIDELVHAQTQGRIGMYNDINFLARSGKIQKLITKLYKKGFNIYLTSDHGNTLCTGLGLIKGTGVEVETKSRRMIVLKDFADEKELIERYNLIKYPGYYLDKQFEYLICNAGTSFDAKDSIVMTHGGISIDEVVVPFIKIEAVHCD